MSIPVKNITDELIWMSAGFMPHAAAKATAWVDCIKLEGGSKVHVIPLSFTQVKAIKDHKVTSKLKAMLAEQISLGLNSIGLAGPVLLSDADTEAQADEVAKQEQEVSDQLSTLPSNMAGWEMCTEAQMKSLPPIKLASATMMYQPVQGTSKNSRYFLVGANKNIRIAARMKGSALSIRFEGEGLQKLAANLNEVGIQSLSKEYASIHLTISDPVLAAKALGAVLLGLRIDLDTPAPNLNRLKGVGS